jgi:bifunctional non-homologous end joining protein LigD
MATKKTSRTPRANGASDAVDTQLARYRSMRDFHITAEPAGATKTPTPATLPFCIQKHAASHLHYDFRLGWNGVLKSWAVAKGPSYVTADKRLAVQVEDHPMEYGGFEGIIPPGQYGGGTVMLWDQGTWEPQAAYPDVDAGLRDGSLKFLLHGTKMQGKWALIRMKPRPRETKPTWLLIKEHDPFERTPTDPAITEAEPNSVVTGRSLDLIAASEDHIWNSKETAAATSNAPAWRRQPGKADVSMATTIPNKSVTLSAARSAQSRDLPASRVRKSSSSLFAARFSPTIESLPTETQPAFLEPQLAQSAEKPPTGTGWLHELKLDGYRIQARKADKNVQLFTRSGLDWTHRMPAIAAAVAALPVAAATLDGEVVVLAPSGTTNFADLQAAFQNDAKHPLTYFCFDLLHLDRRNPRDLPLRERKTLLATLLASADPDHLQLSEHLETGGEAMFHKACELHAEGIVSKLATSKYTAGRSATWLKLKCLHEQEFVIGGYTLPSAGHTGMHGIGALLLGYYDSAKLIYAGRTGTGFTAKTHKLLRDRLEALAQPTTPFDKPPAEARKGAHWVAPSLVAQVRFATWTADKLVRQAAFLGLREDKPAAEVIREDAAPTPRRANPAPTPGAASTLGAPSIAPSAMGGSVATIPSANGAPYPSLGQRPRSAAHPAASELKAGANTSPAQPPIRLTHPNKILDPESGLTKQALADYLFAVADRMLPHIANRPLSLVRCPEGSTKPCFFQKHVNHMLPRDIGGVDVPNKKTGEMEPYITLATAHALAGLAQMGVLEVHPWGSRNDDLEHPDRLTIDLDPDESLPWPTVTAAALDVRARLKQLGLAGFVKTTGGKGLHIVVPIEPTLDWTTAKEFAHRFVLAMEKAAPRLYLTKMSKAARTGRIYLDYLRNERGATAVAPYSTRARAGVPVSMPLAWAELDSPDRPIFRVDTLPTWRTRLTPAKDPWKSLAASAKPITPETLATLGVKS